MPNLVLTTACRNACPFCFARNAGNPEYMDFDFVRSRMAWAVRSGMRRIHLVGGEPAMHPRFTDIVDLLIHSGIEVTIFTDGALPDETVRYLQNLPDASLLFSVNRSVIPLSDRIIRFYQSLGYRVKLNVTLYRPDQDIRYLFDEITTYRLIPEYRLSLAMPVHPDFSNAYLLPEMYTRTAEALFPPIQEGAGRGIRPTFDCGFPLCFFSDTQRRWLEEHDIVFQSLCGVVPDLMPDGRALHCFPLSHISRPVDRYPDLSGLKEVLKEDLNRLRERTLFAHCRTCDYFECNVCSGGCAAFRIPKDHPRPKRRT